MIPLEDKETRGGWVFNSAGGVFTYGNSPFYGSFVDLLAEEERVLSASVSKQNGYQVITNKGNIYTAGIQRTNRSLQHGQHSLDIDVATLNTEKLAIYSESLNKILIYGLAELFSDEDKPEIYNVELDELETVVDMIFVEDDEGLYLLLNNGRIVTLGKAIHRGDFYTEKIIAKPVSMSKRNWGNGYFIMDSMGGIFCFGDVDYFGSVPGDGMKIEAAQILGHSSGRGYWILDKFGRLFPFGYADSLSEPGDGLVENAISFVPDYINYSENKLFGARNITEYLSEEIKNKKELENNEN